ncbi:MAG: hypothetical protein LUO93_05960 [Methanomicrobiales archaeon]|nr:hypothetical protein [Methanomicrobiales archaeon]
MRKTFLITDDKGARWAVYDGDPGYPALLKLKGMGYRLEDTPIPREVLFLRPPTRVIIYPRARKIADMKAEMADFVRRDLS